MHGLAPMNTRARPTGSDPNVDAKSVVPGAAPLSVSQLTAQIKLAVEHAFPSTVHVVGEISNFKRHGSGHVYLTLKDPGSELSCVMWKSDAARLKFEPKDGMEVVAGGSIEVFERAGRYQLYIRRLEPRGIGALELAFRQLCEKLQKEGLFEAGRKRPLPKFPERIALVTSPTGAALADMLRTIERRYPCVSVLLYPVRVQGEGAAGEIAAAIRAINANHERLGGIDVMIVGRGGGSLEDLWAFNEEIVARAIHASRIPVVSAVGHEVDVTISDLVADVRAATPTAAAELVVPVLDEVLADLGAHALRLSRSVRGRMDVVAARFAGLLKQAPFREPIALVRRREQVVDELSTRAVRSLSSREHQLRQRVEAGERIVARIAPHRYLAQTTVRLRDAWHRLHWAWSRRSTALERRLGSDEARLAKSSPTAQVVTAQQHVDRLGSSVQEGMAHRLELLVARIAAQETLLGAVSHRSVLARGFSITRTKKGRTIVRSASDVRDGQRLLTQLADGEFESETRNIEQRELFDE